MRLVIDFPYFQTKFVWGIVDVKKNKKLLASLYMFFRHFYLIQTV